MGMPTETVRRSATRAVRITDDVKARYTKKISNRDVELDGLAKLEHHEQRQITDFLEGKPMEGGIDSVQNEDGSCKVSLIHSPQYRLSGRLSLGGFCRWRGALRRWRLFSKILTIGISRKGTRLFVQSKTCLGVAAWVGSKILVKLRFSADTPDGPVTFAFQRAFQFISRIAPTSEHMAQEWIEAADWLQGGNHTIAILYTGAVNDQTDHKAVGVGHDMTLAAFDLLACIIPANPTTFGGFDALAVDDTGTGARFLTLQLTRRL